MPDSVERLSQKLTNTAFEPKIVLKTNLNKTLNKQIFFFLVKNNGYGIQSVTWTNAQWARHLLKWTIIKHNLTYLLTLWIAQSL